MSLFTPSIRATGDLITAATWNEEHVDNIDYLVTAGASLASAATITPTNEFHIVTGTTTIANLTPASPVAGQQVRLLFQSALTVQNNGGGTGNIRTRSGSDLSVAAGDVVTFVYDGSLWQQQGSALTATAIAASYYAGGTTVAGNNSQALVTLNTSVFSTGASFSLSGGRIVLPKAGTWLCVGHITFPASNTTGVRECDVAHYNASGGFVRYIANDDTPGEAGLAQNVVGVAIDTFAANEQVALTAYQDSGGSLTLPGGSAYVSQALTVTYLGS